MRIVFMGTPEFAEISLNRILRSPHRVAGVVTQPDRPKGRGLKFLPSPVKALALKHHLPVFQPERLPDRELMNFLEETRPEAIVVVAYGLKIPPALLDFSPHGCINLHASLLPKYRGASPIQWALINGESETGVTTMKMDEGWDTGPILLSKSVVITEEDNFASLHDRLADIGADLLVETLSLLEDNKLVPKPQENRLATTSRKLTESDTILNWAAPTRSLFHLIRALDPWPGAKTVMNGETIKVWASRPAQEWFALQDAPPGRVGEYSLKDGGIPVRTGDGVLLITELQTPGKKRLTARQFLAGNRIPPGTILG